MIVKILTRHKQDYAGLIKYILKNDKKADVVTHNLKGNSHTWAEQFKRNESFRKVERENSVRMTHEIISFSSLDKGKVTKAMLSDISISSLIHRFA